MKRLFSFALLLAFFAASCQKEAPQAGGYSEQSYFDDGNCHILVAPFTDEAGKAVERSKSANFNAGDEDKIRDLNVLVYRNGILVNGDKESGLRTYFNSASFSVASIYPNKADSYNVYIIANVGELSPEQLAQLNREQDIINVYRHQYEKYQDFIDSGFPMTGVFRNIVPENHHDGYLLKRMVSRYDLTIKGDNCKVKPNSCRVFQVSNDIQPFGAEISKGGSIFEEKEDGVAEGDFFQDVELRNNKGTVYCMENYRGVIFREGVQNSERLLKILKPEDQMLSTFIELNAEVNTGRRIYRQATFRRLFGAKREVAVYRNKLEDITFTIHQDFAENADNEWRVIPGPYDEIHWDDEPVVVKSDLKNPEVTSTTLYSTYATSVTLSLDKNADGLVWGMSPDNMNIEEKTVEFTDADRKQVDGMMLYAKTVYFKYTGSENGKVNISFESYPDGLEESKEIAYETDLKLIGHIKTRVTGMWSDNVKDTEQEIWFDFGEFKNIKFKIFKGNEQVELYPSYTVRDYNPLEYIDIAYTYRSYLKMGGTSGYFRVIGHSFTPGDKDTEGYIVEIVYNGKTLRYDYNTEVEWIEESDIEKIKGYFIQYYYNYYWITEVCFDVTIFGEERKNNPFRIRAKDSKYEFEYRKLMLLPDIHNQYESDATNDYLPKTVVVTDRINYDKEVTTRVNGYMWGYPQMLNPSPYPFGDIGRMLDIQIGTESNHIVDYEKDVEWIRINSQEEYNQLIKR